MTHINRIAGSFEGDLDKKPGDDEENPKSEYLRREIWPRDPLGDSRPAFVSLLQQLAVLTRPESREQLIAELEQISVAGSNRGKELLGAAQLVIRELSERNKSEQIFLPKHLSVSALMTLAKSPEDYAARLRRPLPFKPDPIARRGTAFHTWLEEKFADSIPLIGDDEMPGAADASALDDSALEKLKAKWLRSEWADRKPHRVEVPFERSVAGTIIRGRMDAVYKSDDGTFDVVDWKTGSAKSGTELENAAIQLAVYRLAWSEIAEVPLERVRAAFHYVGSEETVRPSDLLDHEGLLTLIRSVPVEPS